MRCASQRTRRKRSRGIWMQLRDPELLAEWMSEKDFTQSRLARYSGTSRQFIHLLVTGQRRTCTKQVGELIEEALGVVPRTLFVPHKSPTSKPNSSKRETAA